MEHPATSGQKPSCDWTLTDYYLNYIRVSLCITKTYRKLCSIPCSNFTTFWYQNSFTVPYVGTLNLHHSICLHHSNYPVSDVASQISKINSMPHTPSYPLRAWVWGYIHRWSCPMKAWSTRSNEWCSHLLYRLRGSNGWMSLRNLNSLYKLTVMHLTMLWFEKFLCLWTLLYMVL